MAPEALSLLGRRVGAADPVRFFVILVAASALAYIPLAIAFTPWDWANFGPFSLQLSRPLHYLVYFAAGVALGAYGIERGLLACDGMLARRWAMWLTAALAGFGLWAVPTSMAMKQGSDASLVLQVAAGLGYVVACAAGCLALLAVCLRFLRERKPVMDGLSANAYGLYLVHYIFAVWLQYALLNAPLFAVIKAAIVFAGTLALSWAAVTAFSRMSLGGQPVAVKREARSA
jgi:surface polysaccharide O-acyltransferase-like enzyme